MEPNSRRRTHGGGGPAARTGGGLRRRASDSPLVYRCGGDAPSRAGGLRRHRDTARLAPGTDRAGLAALPRGDLSEAHGAVLRGMRTHGPALRGTRRPFIDPRELALAAVVSRSSTIDRR